MYKKAQEYAPDVPRYYQQTATAQLQLGDYTAAQQTLDQMVQAIPGAQNTGDYQIVLGELARRQGDLLTALNAAQSAISASGSDSQLMARAYRLAADVCQESGNVEMEISLLEEGVAALPAGYYNALAGQLAAAYLQQAENTGFDSSRQKALEVYQKMLSMGNTSLEVRLNIAMLQYQTKKFGDALTTLQALEGDYPSDYRVYEWLAFVDGELAAQKGGSYQQTLAYYNKAMELYQTAQAQGVYDPQMDQLKRMAANYWQ